jgi:hypothetical protein
MIATQAATVALQAIAKAKLSGDIMCADVPLGQAIQTMAVAILGEVEAQRVWDEAIAKPAKPRSV